MYLLLNNVRIYVPVAEECPDIHTCCWIMCPMSWMLLSTDFLCAVKSRLRKVRWMSIRSSRRGKMRSTMSLLRFNSLNIPSAKTYIFKKLRYKQRPNTQLVLKLQSLLIIFKSFLSTTRVKLSTTYYVRAVLT